MEILKDKQKIHEMFCECMFTDHYKEQLTKYEIEKLYEYGFDFEDTLHPNSRDSIKHYLATKKHLEKHPLIDRVDTLMKYFRSILYPAKEIETKSKNKTTYQWQGKIEIELPKLFEKMKGKFISDETTIEQFRTIFTGQPIESITPIKWHNETASELLYFNNSISDRVNKIWDIYIRMKSCFVKPNGKPFNQNFKAIMQNLNTNLSEDKQRAIDNLLK